MLSDPAQNTNAPVYVTRQQARDRLGYRSEQSIDRLIKAGTLTAYRFPGSRTVRLRFEEVERLLTPDRPELDPETQAYVDSVVDSLPPIPPALRSQIAGLLSRNAIRDDEEGAA